MIRTKFIDYDICKKSPNSDEKLKIVIKYKFGFWLIK